MVMAGEVIMFNNILFISAIISLIDVKFIYCHHTDQLINRRGKKHLQLLSKSKQLNFVPINMLSALHVYNYIRLNSYKINFFVIMCSKRTHGF